jgi:rhodanese-related sulfurtransferase
MNVELLRHTPISMAEVKALLADYVGQPALAYLMAMVDLENRHGEAIYEYNWGNITTTDESDGFRFDDPNVTNLFQRNDSHEEGAAEFFKRLNSPTHRRILQAAERNDFEAFFDGITLPHPKTKMVYCYGGQCRSAAAKNTYRQLVTKYLPQGTALGHSRSGGFPWAPLLAVVSVAAAAGGGAYLLTRGKKARRPAHVR